MGYHAGMMAKAFTLTVAVPFALLLTGGKPYSRAAAEKSFRTLVAAKDADILNLIKNDGLVCFADSLPTDEEDRFLTIDLPRPTEWFQEKTKSDSEEQGSIYDGKSDLPAFSPAYLSFHAWVNQDWTSIIDSIRLESSGWHSYGHYEIKDGKRTWKPFGVPPVFRFSVDKDEFTSATNISASEDDTTFYASKKFENRNNGTTTYEMNVRLSTGRYKEVWTPDKGEPMESVGNCYKAKEFVRATTGKKK